MLAIQLSIQAQRRPDQNAVIYGARQISHAQLHARSSRLARALAAQGVEPGDRVAVLLHNCPAFFDALFGCAKLGAIFVPINFRLSAREVGAGARGLRPIGPARR